MLDVDQIRKQRSHGLRLERRIEQTASISRRLRRLSLLAHYYAGNMAGIFSNSFIENTIADISNAAITDVTLGVPERRTLHVMTEAYRIGGHTRVVERHAELIPGEPHDVLLLNEKSDIPESLASAVSRSRGQMMRSDARGYLEKARELIKVASTRSRVLLHVHMWDIVPILAFGNCAWDRPIYFSDHANHLFWVGVGISDVVLSDLGTGSERMQKRGVGRAEVDFVPIVPPQRVTERLKKADLGIAESTKVILTMATDYKYSPFGDYDILKIVATIQEQLGEEVHLVVIGGDNRNHYWLGTDLRVTIIPPTLHYRRYFALADLYLDSIPLSSPMCLYEAIAHGLSAVTFATPLFSPLGMGNSTHDGVRKAVAILRGALDNNGLLLKELKRRSFPEQWATRMAGIFESTRGVGHRWHPFKEREEIGPEEIFLHRLLSRTRLPPPTLYE